MVLEKFKFKINTTQFKTINQNLFLSNNKILV